jgi:hypothetical protein
MIHKPVLLSKAALKLQAKRAKALAKQERKREKALAKLEARRAKTKIKDDKARQKALNRAVKHVIEKFIQNYIQADMRCEARTMGFTSHSRIAAAVASLGLKVTSPQWSSTVLQCEMDTFRVWLETVDPVSLKKYKVKL